VINRVELKGATAVVAGGCGGIGTAVCVRLAEEGARIAVLDLVPPDELESKLAERGLELWYARTDLADPASIADGFRALDDALDAPRVLVNAAGVGGSAPCLELTVQQWDETLAVNARGLFFASQAAARRMKGQGVGSIVNILSTASVQGFAGGSAYCASKGAALLVTRTLAIELAQHGITVNGVAPGTVRTPMSVDYIATSSIAGHELSRTPLGRFGEPEEIAEVVAFLCTRASWITGEVIYVDGGFLATGMPVLD
jgi:NAD(P)-dependent dehydrogenase (short-subunit alcohol dehydrogenase family)